MVPARRLALVGTGLIGGSIGLALGKAGYDVVGFDRDAERAGDALAAGAVGSVAATLAEAVHGADLTVIAVPVGQVAETVIAALDAGASLVTDVGSVKAPVVTEVERARPALAVHFIGGHPMAGSEQEGLAGADADLFVGATWVLTPTGRTDPQAFASVRAVVASLGAEAIAVAPELHDTLVAVVSHVPQLAASTLMNVASARGDEHSILLRLAAGGFRDMTRIASSHPAIWPDICLANRDAIVSALDGYLDELTRVRAIVAGGERTELLELLETARVARRNLPVGLPLDEALFELRIPVPDREGVIAEVATLAATFGVNIRDFEIAHSLEGRSGVLVLVVGARGTDAFEAALHEHGYHTAADAARMTDELTIVGRAPLRGRLRVPGDKGISHRALLFAAMADGRSRAIGLAGGDDVYRTRRALTQLGVPITIAGSGVTIDGRSVDALTESADAVDCGNSGTSIRTLTGLVAGRPFRTTLSGDESLRTRPMRRIVEPLRAMGARIDGPDDGARPPLTVDGGELVGCAHVLAVASAQVKTALVLAGLQASGVTEITEPHPSRDHTERMLEALGAPLERVDATTIRVRTGAPSPFEAAIPGDPSSAAFWLVGAAVTPDSDVVVEGVACNPTRIAFVDVLRRMGATIEVELTGDVLGEPVGNIRVTTSSLTGTTIAGAEIALVQDEIPALAVAAAFADGVTEVHDAAELRVKESDRIATVEELVRAIGVDVQVSDSGLVITGGKPRAARLQCHGDHRIAMAAAIAANAIDGESLVVGWRAAGVSYPEFSDDLAVLTGHAT